MTRRARAAVGTTPRLATVHQLFPRRALDVSRDANTIDNRPFPGGGPSRDGPQRRRSNERRSKSKANGRVARKANAPTKAVQPSGNSRVVVGTRRPTKPRRRRCRNPDLAPPRDDSPHVERAHEVFCRVTRRTYPIRIESVHGVTDHLPVVAVTRASGFKQLIFCVHESEKIAAWFEHDQYGRLWCGPLPVPERRRKQHWPPRPFDRFEPTWTKAAWKIAKDAVRAELRAEREALRRIRRGAAP